jgi:hypothetical protein
MEDLIRALQILLKYGNPDYPTWCEHDALHICDITHEDVSEEDVVALDALGFFPEDDGFISFKFGSA